MISSQDGVFNLGTTAITVPAGATMAVLFEHTAGQTAWLLKYGSGGSLELIGAPSQAQADSGSSPGAGTGQTLTAAQLVTAAGKHYLVGTSEALRITGPARFYLQALNITTICYAIRGKAQGN